jgi:hypothetical protein
VLFRSQDGAAHVVVIEVQRLKLGLVHALVKGGQGLLHIRRHVLALATELVQDLQVGFLGLETVEDADLFCELLFLLLKSLGFFGVVPGVGRGQLLVQGFDLSPDLTQVKENLGAVRAWSDSHRAGPGCQ